MLDCGTGSGALLLTLLAERTGWIGTGIDASAAALDVARRNAAALDLAERATLAQRDWTRDGWRDGLGHFDLVIANPPYVESDAVLDRSVREYEPGAALFAGADGLDDYRILVPQLPALLAPGGVAVLEIGATQDDSVAALARDNGFATALRRDLARKAARADIDSFVRQAPWQSRTTALPRPQDPRLTVARITSRRPASTGSSSTICEGVVTTRRSAARSKGASAHRTFRRGGTGSGDRPAQQSYRATGPNEGSEFLE